jgi:NADP-dependent 3-hydroxy acid dehydrogenase YdfG
MNKELIIVTGASSGIGQATAEKFANEGHPLLLIAKESIKSEKLCGSNSVCVKIDISDRQAVDEAVKKAEKLFGPTGGLINCAGGM